MLRSLVLVLSLGAAALAPLSALPGAAEAGGTGGASGGALAVAAAVNDMSPAELREVLATDETAHLDDTHRLFYEEPAHVEPAAAASSAAAYPLDQTFALHSRPGSQRTIYLDFDGVSVQGTVWNDNGLPAGTYGGYSIDGSAAFSDTEKANVQSIWQRVAEDYAPFDVDVTTQDPGDDAITRSGKTDLVFGTRAVITDDATVTNQVCSGCGGVAYVGVFSTTSRHAYYQPAWILASRLSNSTKSIAEAASHEVGHNLGLKHDGQGSSEYYAPSGTWAPIMGAGYNAPVTQWSDGDYAGATNTQDDLAVITAGGAPYVADDASDNTLTASSDLTGTKLIGTTADVDVFALPACAETRSVSATPAAVSPDLDLRVELLDSAGAVVAAADPAVARASADVATGLDASAAATGPVSWVRVSGVGSAAYSDYASLGRYTLSLACGAEPVTPVAPPTTSPTTTGSGSGGTTTEAPLDPSVTVVGPAAPVSVRAVSGRKGGRLTATVRWSAARKGGPVTGYQVVVISGGHQRVVATLSGRASAYTFRSKAGGAYRFAVIALGTAGATDTSAPTAPVRVR